MSTTEIEVTDYTVVAEVRGHDVLWFRRFGSYQGEWLMFSRDEESYFIWKDWYGSCSGCDAIEGSFGHSGKAERAAVEAFAQEYQPFLKLRPDAALNIAKRDGNLLAVLPRNQRDWASDIPQEEVGRQLALVVKGLAGELTATEILEIDNQESRRQAIEKMGAERFVDGLGADAVEATDEGTLYRIPREGVEDYAFLYVKDPSTERRYVIRVNPQHQTVRAARASTFGMTESEFVLAQET